MKFFFILLMALLNFSRLISSGDDSWAVRTIKSMSLKEKIGQLFMVAGYVDSEFAKKEIDSSTIIQDIDDYIINYCIGGIAYVGPSSSIRQVGLSNHYQKISKYPILIAQDLEWGLSMRLEDGLNFPKNITLGAIEDNELIYKMGKEIGAQAQLIGVHINLSPVLDVNMEPENPVINIRSFGNSPHKVAEKGVAMIKGLQDAGIIASAKHFPGLGDINIDPHLGLPFLSHGEKRLRDVELYPFMQAIKANVLSIQTEHVLVPSLEPDANTPASLSSKIVNDLLKNELGFTGLIISGALRMKALTNNFSNEEIILKAFLAGNDMLLMPQDFPKAYKVIERAISNGKISEKELNKRVLKILQLKEKVKLDKQRFVAIPTHEQLRSPYAEKLKNALYQAAVSLFRNEQDFLPISIFNKAKVAYIQCGETSSSECVDQLRQSFGIDLFNFSSVKDNSEEEKRLFAQIDCYSLIILAVHPIDPRRIAEIRLLTEKNQANELKNFRVHGLTEFLLKLNDNLKPYHKKIIVAYFGNPFGIHFFNKYHALIMAYEDLKDTQKAVANLLIKQIRFYK